MNHNDLMNSLSGIDPRYIDEAAFELHEKPADKRKAKVTSIRKSLFVVLPAAAAILLTVTALFTLKSSKSNRSAEAPAADAAAKMPAAEMPMAEEAAEAPAEAAEEAEETYEAEPIMNDEAPAAIAEDHAEAEAADEAAPAYDMNDKTQSPQFIMPETNTGGAEANPRLKEDLILNTASYDDGILTVKMTGKLPADPGSLGYSITGKGTDGADKTFGEGTLKDIIKEKDPLTLDIADLKLPEGTYILSIGEESFEFEVR